MEHVLFLLLLFSVTLISVFTKKLSAAAAIAAVIVAACIYAGTSFSGIVLLGAFFIMGVAATSWKKRSKELVGLAEGNKGKRNTGQVLANASVAAILALMTIALPEHQPLLFMMMACSFSSATADTVSSELGVIYGTHFYNITSFKKDTRGENGVISWEGTLLGFAASILIGLIYCLLSKMNITHAILVVMAGTIGNITDSIAGATLERNKIIGNNTVNLLNTLVAAAAGGLMYYLVSL